MDNVEITNDNSDVTTNSKQIALLKAHFPQCFDKDGNFMMQKMEEIVGDEGLELSKESYSLNWLGKSYARLLANENPHTLLKEDKEHNAQTPHSASENLLIKGDNLEVLKHLNNAYSEAIKMIYIDPPYNTGKDGFVYQDDRKFTAEELSHLAGVDIEESRHILEFTQSKANSHSAWLTFMYPRLYIARHLLKEDGVIFISIDDNEQAQLKLLCDEVFGEENFVTNIIWEKKTGASDSNTISTITEYVLVYVRTNNSLLDIFERNTESYDLERYKLTDEFLEERGPYYLDNLDRGGLQYSDSMNFGIEMDDSVTLFPNGRTKYENDGWIWKWGEDKVKWGFENKFLEIKPSRKKSSGFGVYYKNYLKVDNECNPIDRSAPLKNLLIQGVKNTDGTSDIQKLFDCSIFKNPKPVEYLKRLINFVVTDNEFILDFFAGSGTLSHAVMELNKIDSQNRHFISVQIPELIDPKKKLIYNFVKNTLKKKKPTIFDITKARIEKAALKISEENPEFTGDLGFKIFETIPVFEGYLDEIDNLEDDTTLFDGSTLSNDELDTLLTTWRVHDGMTLTEKLEEVVLGSYKAHYGNGTVYMMSAGFQTDDLKSFIKKLDEEKEFEPSKVVLFGYNFKSKHQREFKEALNTYLNRKSIELDLVIRY